ncbi:NAD(P)/FAD-dependent oxidoreductase [Reichenbachiella ulvae]|uniref:NAD(P)/FAD-dependent oxidoreductase n=1 Tax=Reichenbachiella ulvae TaxID=2980104 RepID=A0ABT3CN10_9BACT|nr:NAD(P)/FAD-dependent oxidoreductase [Reichenbachiella ulvae]MCV9385106.1 NAD(P)/FAD-dependent oxidoreductase [Reichenbachiella ulvae]
MEQIKIYDTIIIGGSYAGLSAAMALGRSLRQVLIIDSGQPCNAQTPHSHNFITQDGVAPGIIAGKARAQVLAYDSISFYEGLALNGRQLDGGFEIETDKGERFKTKKLLFASGIRDLMPDIPGIKECWGISVIHCPYCHGYEVRNQKTGILASGEVAFEMGKLISNWTFDLTLYTQGESSLKTEQVTALKNKGILINEKQVVEVSHDQGQIKGIEFRDGSKESLNALYVRLPFEQKCQIPNQLGCEVDEQGYLVVNRMQKTSLDGVYACGDCTSPFRSVANAVQSGSFAGAVINKDLIEEEFLSRK